MSPCWHEELPNQYNNVWRTEQVKPETLLNIFLCQANWLILDATWSKPTGPTWRKRVHRFRWWPLGAWTSAPGGLRTWEPAARWSPAARRRGTSALSGTKSWAPRKFATEVGQPAAGSQVAAALQSNQYRLCFEASEDGREHSWGRLCGNPALSRKRIWLATWKQTWPVCRACFWQLSWAWKANIEFLVESNNSDEGGDWPHSGRCWAWGWASQRDWRRLFCKTRRSFWLEAEKVVHYQHRLGNQCYNGILCNVTFSKVKGIDNKMLQILSYKFNSA